MLEETVQRAREQALQRAKEECEEHLKELERILRVVRFTGELRYQDARIMIQESVQIAANQAAIDDLTDQIEKERRAA